MLSEEIRRRLALLNRQSLPAAPGPATIPAPHFTLAPRPTSDAETIIFEPSHELATQGESGSLGYDVLAAGVEYENASGKHLRCARSLTGVCATAVEQLASYANRPLVVAVPESIAASTIAQPPTDAVAEAPRDFQLQPPPREPRTPATPATPELHPELAALARHLPNGTLFLDLETCGFSGSMVFLVGLVWQRDGELVLDQLLARNYAEERAILETLWQIAAQSQVLVTFNGKSFDWPMVHDRSTRHLLGLDGRVRKRTKLYDPLVGLGPNDARPLLVHCDLLHHARRRWKTRLPNCKLQTLERAICRRNRYEDVSGAAIPAAYHEFVRGGDDRAIKSILHHNALDLVTLAQVAARMLVELRAEQG